MDNTINVQKQISVFDSKDNSLMNNNTGLIHTEHKKPNTLLETKFATANTLKPSLTVAPPKKDNKITLPSQPFKPVVKQPVINKGENINNCESLFDYQSNENEEMNIFNSKIIDKHTPTYIANKQPPHVNFNKIGHTNIPKKVINNCTYNI